ncbi:MAG: IS701 family transposase, partial [Nitrososphaeria archaeon]
MRTAKERGFSASYVLFESWYSSLENLKIIREYGWHFFTRLKSNRLVNPVMKYNVPVSSIEIPPEG